MIVIIIIIIIIFKRLLSENFTNGTFSFLLLKY